MTTGDDEPEASRSIWWWLSFASEADGHNLGVIVLRAELTVMDAIAAARALDYFPGGQVQATMLFNFEDSDVDEQFQNRLLTAEEALILEQFMADAFKKRNGV